jgi:iron complex transport system ATP-binding protein
MTNNPSTDSHAVVSMTDVSFAYGAVPVLQQLNFSFSQSTINFIVGPNGSGKSTIAGLLGGMLQPNGGEIRLLGRPSGVVSHRDRSHLLALVPQKLVCPFDYSVTEFIRMARYHRTDEISGHRLPTSDSDALAEAMRLAGVQHLTGRAFHELSVGEQQRVAIARMLAQDTPIIVMDEPTSALDIEHQLSLLNLIRRIREQGGCVIWITHDLPLVLQHADSVLVLSEGTVAAAGPPHTALDDATLEAVFHVRRGVSQQTSFELTPESRN